MAAETRPPIARTPEASRSEQDSLLRAIFETSPDGLITIDQNGRIRSFNPAAERLFGYRATEVVGRDVSCLMPTPYREQHAGYIERYLRTGEKRIIGIGREVVGQRKDGTLFPLELAIGEVRAASGRIFAGFVHDVSARRRTEAKLHELQDEFTHVARLSAMGEMASALAHELNQPLTAIINYAQATRRLLDIGPEGAAATLASQLDKIVQQGSRAGEIIHRLRQFIAKGKTERTLESVNTVIEEASALALIGVADKGIEVCRTLDRDLPPVLIDKIQIHQVITNLIRNSVDALGEVGGGRIFIETDNSGDGQVGIHVADTGPGLAQEVSDRLFQPFVTTKPTGMGIGLSICRTIVEGHGGKLSATENPGGGARFSFSLPTAREPS